MSGNAGEFPLTSCGERGHSCAHFKLSLNVALYNVMLSALFTFVEANGIEAQ